MTSQKFSEKTYFPAVVAALLVLGTAIGFFIFNLVETDPNDVDLGINEEVNGLNPSLDRLPDGPPSVPVPDGPPPS